jgi:exosortase C (VPDSG-CTERM-specific)
MDGTVVTNNPREKRFALAAAVLAVAFALPLLRLVRFAAGDELHSYVMLMPFVCAYLAWQEKNKLPAFAAPAKGIAAGFFLAGILALAGKFVFRFGSLADELSLTTFSFVLLLTGIGFLVFGAAGMRVLAFPFSLFIFFVPMPDFLRDALETGLQHGSAMVAGWFFSVSDVPVLHDGLAFRLPTISLEVAQECSGIHSTMVLFITSLVAGHFFLRSPWRRAALCLFVIPLALLRNGFRVFVLGELCTHIGPQMIDSPIHHRGGPLFFALSLLPFFLLLYLLRRAETKHQTKP